MALNITLQQHVECAAVVAIAQQACEAILRVYNSEVGRREPPKCVQQQRGTAT